MEDIAPDWWQSVSSTAARLEAAVCAGNADEAALQARLLSEQRVLLDIRPAAAPLTMPPAVPGRADGSVTSASGRSLLDEGWFALPVAVEGPGRPSQLLRLLARGETRIGELRARLARGNRDLPAGRQCWIVGGLLAPDYRSLSELGAVSETKPVHLYVLGRPKTESDATDSAPAPAASAGAEATAATDRIGAKAEADKSAVQLAQTAPPAPRAPTAPRAPPAPRAPTAPSGPGRTWQCPRCTYANHWRRPGCEACTHDRPDSESESDSSDSDKDPKQDFAIAERRFVGQEAEKTRKCISPALSDIVPFFPNPVPNLSAKAETDVTSSVAHPGCTKIEAPKSESGHSAPCEHLGAEKRRGLAACENMATCESSLNRQQFQPSMLN